MTAVDGGHGIARLSVYRIVAEQFLADIVIQQIHVKVEIALNLSLIHI